MIPLSDEFAPGELIRPWKLVSFLVCLTLLILGAVRFELPDWDVGVTLLMGGLTYFLAPASVRLLVSAFRKRSIRRAWRVTVALLAWLLTVDWAYLAYHEIAGNPVLRGDNFRIASPLYIMAGIVWAYRGSLEDLARALRVRA